MDWVSALFLYSVSVLFIQLRNEVIAFKEFRSSRCVKKEFVVEYYECPGDFYSSYKTLTGKRLLFTGPEDEKHAYFHELGHLIYDKFWADAPVAGLILIPFFVLPFPWYWLGAATVYIATMWIRKTQERRADIFAYQVTGLKYVPAYLEKSKLELLIHWLFWSHPPEIVRVKDEYYKKEISLFKLFVASLTS